MEVEKILKAMRHLKVETGSLACLGCGHENSCSTKGCAVIRAAIEALESMQTTGDCISRQAAIDRFMPYVHVDEKIPAETVIEELHMFPAVDMQKQAKIELDSMRAAANSLKMHLENVKTERDAAIDDLRGCAIESCAECMYCRYKTARSFCRDCTDGSNWAYRGPWKEIDCG